MDAIHGTHCNVRYSRWKPCKHCGSTIIWYSCDHLSVRGLPLDSRDPWIEHSCHQYSLHRWKTKVGSTPIGKFISAEMSSDRIQSFEVVMQLNRQLLKLRKAVHNDIDQTMAAINERIRLSEVLLQLPQALRGKDLELPYQIRLRRRQIHGQREELLKWRDELSEARGYEANSAPDDSSTSNSHTPDPPRSPAS